MVLNRYTMIIHPKTLQQIELALGEICTFTTAVDSEGAKSYEVTQMHEAEPTFNQLALLDTVAAVRFIPIEHLPYAPEPLTSDPVRSPVKPASHQNLQELRKFLRLDRRPRR